MTRYAFHFDSSACSGCKACQAACKDRHGLPLGVLWRRVYEISGGSWMHSGEAWQSTVFAYNLSLGCNHCESPVCMEVCPADAFHQRPDGIVLLDSEKCIGCQYCTWACPYGAPQYDARSGKTTKCDSCVDDLDAGLAPACVAGCPLRALQFGDKDELAATSTGIHLIFPLPDPGLTHPALSIKPHPAAIRAKQEAAKIANREEVQPGTGASGDFPLVGFTLLAQTAIGAFWTLLAIDLSGIRSGSGAWTLVPLLMLMGLAVSILHLGRPLAAWRALLNLRRSWLSREVQLALLFFAGSVMYAALQYLQPAASGDDWLAGLLVGGLGLALIYAMAQTYRFRAVQPWNSLRTQVSFFITTLLLGGLTAGLALTPTSILEAGRATDALSVVAAWSALLLISELALFASYAPSLRKTPLRENSSASSPVLRAGIYAVIDLRFRVVLSLLIGLIITAAFRAGMTIEPVVGFWILVALVASLEIQNRCTFYRMRTEVASAERL